MKSFIALLRLQLLSRYADMKPRNLKTALKEKKGRTIGMISSTFPMTRPSCWR